MTVCHLVAPSEVDTTRNELGTVRRASSVVLMMIGRVMMESVREAARMLVPNLRKTTNNPSPNKSIDHRRDACQVDDGDADQAGEAVFLCVFRKIDTSQHADGDRKERGTERKVKRSHDGRQNAALAHAV